MRNNPAPPRAPPLHFSRDGQFKIMQIADFHYSVSVGECRDTMLSPCKESDNLTTTLLGRMLDIEKPDVVVFTGDGEQLGRAVRACEVCEGRHEPTCPLGAAIFGNHDDEDGMSRETQLRYLQGLPYSLVERGPKDVHGVGNYVLKVKSAEPYVHPDYMRNVLS